MAITHGNKKYYQLLLEPNKAALLEEFAKEEGVRPTAFMRQVLTEYLAENCDQAKFMRAVVEDEEIWQQSIQNRVDGRKKSRAVKLSRGPKWWAEFFLRRQSEHTSE